MNFRYYTKMREPGPGAVPKAGLIQAAGFGERKWDEAHQCHAWGYADYNRRLTEAEVEDYELIGPDVVEAKNRFYFTFGLDENMPFYGGWIEILANDYGEARNIFAQHYPDRGESGCLKFAFQYTEEEWKRTVMHRTGSNMGYGCWAVIDGEEVTVL